MAQPTAELEKVFGTLNLKETFAGDEFKSRPAPGKNGRPLTVFANMYPVAIKPGQTVWHYTADIDPVVKVAKQKEPRQLMQDVWVQAGKEAKGAIKTAFEAAAYDLVGNVWSPVEFPLDGSSKCEVVVNLLEDGSEAKDDKRRFKIVMRPAMSNRSSTAKHTIDLDSIGDFCKGTKLDEQAAESMLVATQAMNVLLRQDVSLRYKAVGAQGRRFFGTDGASLLPEGGVCLSGFMQSFRFTQSGHAAVQLDTAYSAFFKAGPLVDLMGEILGTGGGGGFRGGRGGPRGGAPGGGAGGLQTLDMRQIAKLNGLLRSAKFELIHRKSSRQYTFLKITAQPAAECKFLLDGKDGKESKMVTIPEYYKQTYNVTLQKPRLPCISFGAGGKNKVPLELVRLVEYNSIPFLKLSGDQTAAMIKVAAKRPEDRVKMIGDWRKKLDWGNLPKVKAWNVKIDPNMMQVKARVLAPPVITYSANKTQQPSGGRACSQWNMRNTKYAKAGKSLKSWAIVNLDGRLPMDVIQGFVVRLAQNLNITNCPVENTRPPIVDGADGRRFDVMQQGFSCIKPALQNGAREAYMQSKINPQLIVIILPNKDLGRYAEIKRCAMQDLRMPVVTQLLQSQKISPTNRGMDQYVGNIHCKVGGVTHHVPMPNILDKTTMMIGADVTHPPPAGAGQIAPSIAVTIASISGDNNLFCPEIRIQEGRKESITDLKDMVKQHLITFQKNAKALPAKIIMFRDGVSEGQFAMCATEEYEAMLKAAREMDPKYRPKITFVICAKRHSMRFFAMTQQDGDRTGNLQPGLVVDTGVCHPFAFDFYLQAHSGLQGTARPTHYVVVKDDIGFDADKMQGLCNSLCYSYSRACRSVSLIPVAYYCDIIAGKCRDFLYKDDSDVAASVSSGSGPDRPMEFNSMELMKRIQSNPDFNSVAWYM
ncbi:putative eukaryotic translation initiation factor 2C 2 [Dioszegia hungarica]|uniref:Eukaryotic translation initiation factor 2C 2 n=1 Tax=Dioszegia hungarica TaxID=4972 RepID=A0AA38HCJ8_9TREE|nr:putative eukaryotic translation initiation factor 2C 2 [Dioszegia hungarica]KAI9636399.1 putative eukaryotic translation initiation factor 2C 2 [Dioszegia hungarica]